jgi:hypothetical protein
MPLFYLRPFDFHADRKAHTHAPIVEFDRSDLLLFGVMALFAFGLFVAFVIVPMLTVMLER